MPIDPRDIARAVLKGLADKERVVRQVKESQAAMARYEWDKVAARYDAVFHRVLDKKG